MIRLKNHLVGSLLILFVSLNALNAQAQIFSCTEGTVLLDADRAGEPDVPEGQVRQKEAPEGTGNIAAVKDRYLSAGVSSELVNHPRFLGEGVFASNIAGMSAVINTANQLDTRPESIAPDGAIFISTLDELSNNRDLIADNTTRTFVFRDFIEVDRPIMVGDNTTIWVDGTLNYDGFDVVTTGGFAFTPHPSKYDGVFSIRDEGTFIEGERNDELLAQLRAHDTRNVTFRGTKRGKIIIQTGEYLGRFGELLPKTNGILALGASNLTIEGLTIEGALQSFFISGCWNVNITNSFTNNAHYRAMHIHATGNAVDGPWGNITNNLVMNSGLDGIDVDSFSSRWKVIGNVVMGAYERFLYWTEIDAKFNVIDNNVGIILPHRSSNLGAGGFQENGTEQSRNPDHPSYDGSSTGFEGNANNIWTNNNSFYAMTIGDGFVMRKDRFIQYSTITFDNNYVWTEFPQIDKSNPKSTTDTDIYFLVRTPVLPSDNDLIIENGDSGYEEIGIGWTDSGLTGLNGSSTRFGGPDIGASATWTPDITEAGEYEVFIYRIVFESNSDPNAKITITHREGTETRNVDYSSGFSGWVSLGTYNFDTGTNGSVKNELNTAGKLIRADAVGFVLKDSYNTLSVTDAEFTTNAFSVYPNPIQDLVSISMNADNLIELSEIAIYDLNGKKIQTFNPNNIIDSTLSLDLTFLRRGIYFLSIGSDTGTITQKIIKE